MIRYIELTPDAGIAFQSGKIIRILVSEGDAIAVGDPLLVVDAQGKEIKLLTNKPGKVNEIIVAKDDVIHKLSSLLILETTVADPPTPESNETTEKAAKTTSNDAEISVNKTKKKPSKKSTSTKKSTGDSDKQSSIDFEKMSNDSAQESSKTQENNTTMSEIKVPDLGGADAVEVIDILVNIGDSVNIDDPLMTVESDKASMDIPASASGTITDILIKVGDSVSEGDVVFKTDSVASNSSTPEAAAETNVEAEHAPVKTADPQKSSVEAQSSDITIIVPDLGGASDVEVIDLLVTEGDNIEADQPIITVESDKASMDIPSSHAGVIKSLKIKVGDTINEGDQIILLASATGATSSTPQDNQEKPIAEKAPKAAPQAVTQAPAVQDKNTPAPTVTNSGTSHASPSVRRLARELGVDLGKIVGTARKNRISKDDVKAFVKKSLATGNIATTGAGGGAGIPEIPAQDFSKFGDIELQPLNKIKRVTAQHLHRSWLNVPLVTHNDEANIQSLEDFRKTLNAEYAKKGEAVKLSPLAFIVKAVINALQSYPQFNSSLENGGNNLIIKKYYNIGVAVETPNGLVVPVIRDADKLSVAEIAVAMGDLAKKARDGQLKPNEMQGGTFSISSLGGIGGTNFTPLVNAPEVAILGVSRTKIQPEWDGSEFKPAPILPLSLSYDHRAIDGAEAARFTRHIATILEDLRRLAL